MSYWNNRVMRRTYGEGEHQEVVDEIYEVYYNDDNTVSGWTQDPVGPAFYVDVDEGNSIRDDVERFLRACDKPILDYETGKEI